MSGGHVFIDETKRRRYLLVAAVVEPGELDVVRKVLRRLILPGQRRLHMKDESDPRKRSIASAIVSSGIRATVYDAGRKYKNERERREACLRQLVTDAAQRGDARLVLERDDSLVTSDRRALYRAVRGLGVVDTLAYEHRRPATEMLLALPDAVAWCWAKGGDWRRRVETVITHVHKV